MVLVVEGRLPKPSLFVGSGHQALYSSSREPTKNVALVVKGAAPRPSNPKPNFVGPL